MFENASFDFLFRGIGKLHAFVGEEFDAVVLIRIVGGRDDDPNMKIIVADEAGDAGGSENTGKRNGGSALEKTSGDDAGDVRTGFAGVRANQRVRRRMVAMKKFGNGKAQSKESGVIERRGPRDAANTVCSEKLSRHRVRGRRAPTDKKFSTAIREGRQSGVANVLT
jgi:hypothetical protein